MSCFVWFGLDEFGLVCMFKKKAVFLRKSKMSVVRCEPQWWGGRCANPAGHPHPSLHPRNIYSLCDLAGWWDRVVTVRGSTVGLLRTPSRPPGTTGQPVTSQPAEQPADPSDDRPNLVGSGDQSSAVRRPAIYGLYFISDRRGRLGRRGKAANIEEGAGRDCFLGP